MLSSFKKPRRNASAAKQQKVNVEKKLAAQAAQNESPPSSDVDSDSDSEYEEILISSINGQPKKVPEPIKEPQESANHANHFTEPEPSVKPVEIKKSAPIPIPRKGKAQKVVIKKYYQQRKKPAEDKIEPQKAPDKTGKFPPAPYVRPQSYIGISSGTHSARTNTHSTMSSRILNW
jgi:hypothetical protein